VYLAGGRTAEIISRQF